MNQQISQLFEEMKNLERKLSESQCELQSTQGQLRERTKSLKQAKQKIFQLEKSFQKDALIE